MVSIVMKKILCYVYILPYYSPTAQNCHELSLLLNSTYVAREIIGYLNNIISQKEST